MQHSHQAIQSNFHYGQKEIPLQYAIWPPAKLMGFQVSVEYREGRTNKAADAPLHTPTLEQVALIDVIVSTSPELSLLAITVNNNKHL